MRISEEGSSDEGKKRRRIGTSSSTAPGEEKGKEDERFGLMYELKRHTLI
jgi:hypothetical protein